MLVFVGLLSGKRLKRIWLRRSKSAGIGFSRLFVAPVVKAQERHQEAKQVQYQTELRDWSKSVYQNMREQSAARARVHNLNRVANRYGLSSAPEGRSYSKEGLAGYRAAQGQRAYAVSLSGRSVADADSIDGRAHRAVENPGSEGLVQGMIDSCEYSSCCFLGEGLAG